MRMDSSYRRSDRTHAQEVTSS